MITWTGRFLFGILTDSVAVFVESDLDMTVCDSDLLLTTGTGGGGILVTPDEDVDAITRFPLLLNSKDLKTNILKRIKL